MSTLPLGLPSWERTRLAVDKVRDRLLRATAALEQAGIDYAVTGDSAVAAWIGQVDQSAVRFTQDADILINPFDFEAAMAVLDEIGFIYRHVKGIDMFLDGPDAKVREAINVIFPVEKVEADHVIISPDVTESEPSVAFRVVRLDALVRMKLTSFRDKDRTHLRDMLDVGLIDETWVSRLPDELAARLETLIDNPEG
jgi:hypothetical protein